MIVQWLGPCVFLVAQEEAAPNDSIIAEAAGNGSTPAGASDLGA